MWLCVSGEKLVISIHMYGFDRDAIVIIMDTHTHHHSHTENNNQINTHQSILPSLHYCHFFFFFVSIYL